jgi:hypothetical protein
MQLWVTVIARPLRFHDTRHTYGTLLAQGGFDGVKLQRAMRHRDFKMTARYVHTNVEDLREVGACLPPATLAPVPEPAVPEPVTDTSPSMRPAAPLPAPVPPASSPTPPHSLAATLAAGLLQVGGKGKRKGPGLRENSQENPAPSIAGPRGFEPLAFGFVVRRSIQLS